MKSMLYHSTRIMSRLSQNASKRIASRITSYLAVPSKILVVVLREPIAQLSGNVVRWCFCKLSRSDDDTNTIARIRQAIINRPHHLVRQYPGLVWVVVYTALDPGSNASQPDAKRTIQEATLGRSTLRRLVPELKIARRFLRLNSNSILRVKRHAGSYMTRSAAPL